MPRRSTSRKAKRLTPRQLQILTMIRDFRRTHGYSPTMQELADAFGVTKVTIFEHVDALQGKGLLRRLPHKARSLELTSQVEFPDESATRIPLAGTIAAGVPIEAIEDNEVIDLEDLFRSRHGTYVLRVRGDSMIDEHIRDGDYVVVERRERARNGETVVALIDDSEATLKKLYREKGQIRLQPANRDYEPIRIDPQRLRIQGVVIGVIRKC